MKEKITHNLGLKILSVVVAALVWLTIMNIDNPIVTETIKDIPVRVINDEIITSRGYQYEIEAGAQVDIRVKGKRSTVDKLTASDFVATADFNSLNAMYMAAISVECLAEDAENLVITLKNENMAVKLEDQETQPYSVRVNLVGNVKDGYYCADARLNSSLIQVTGSLTQMYSLKDVVATVDVEGRSSSFTANCELVAYDGNGKEIDLQKLSFSQNVVTVAVTICPTETVDIKAVISGKPADGYYVEKIEYAPQSGLIAADEKELRAIREITIPCDISGADSNVDIQVDLADFLSKNYENCYAVESPSNIGIIVTIKPMAERTVYISATDVSVVNVPEGLTCEIYTADSYVVMKGPQAVIDRLDISDLRLYVDMKEGAEGTYSCQIISASVPNVEIRTSSVMVRLAREAGNE